MRNWLNRALLAIEAARGDVDAGLDSAFESGRAEENGRWKQSTGFDSPDEYIEAKQARPKPRVPLAHPGQWLHIDGELRFVRGYANGSYGYFTKEGVFMDVEITL